ncbi:MAG: dockerin type I repeat-containing protein, partial [[Eubacterium] siraeum]|nr:dockerin type I repeat-containing protein [[Eubacterium] siraeum]
SYTDSYTSAAGHKYKDEAIAGGGTKHTCTVCGYSYTEGSAQKLGDIDGNGKITSADAMVVLQAVTKIKKLTPEQTAAADVDGNGKITTADVMIILQVVVGIKKL